jgi:hypothetical protein
LAESPKGKAPIEETSENTTEKQRISIVVPGLPPTAASPLGTPGHNKTTSSYPHTGQG